ncbi:MAG: hypothetical protein HYV17_10845 [Xanthomonadales bacterium]|nr:hypothetical protein [Xanthomonadales bacterium]
MRFVSVIVLLSSIATGTVACASCMPEQDAVSESGDSGGAPAEMECPYSLIEDLPVSMDGIRVVDGRPVVSGSEPRIPGSFPVSALPDASGPESVLIVGSGWNRLDERRACAAVRARKYRQASILRGGMRAWARAELPLWTDARGTDALDVLTPTEAHAAAVRGDARLVILPEGALPILCPQTAMGIHCVVSVAQAVAQVQRCASGETIVIAARDDEHLLIAQALPPGLSVMRVAGGSEAMRRHFEQFKSIAESASQTLWIPCHRR